VLIPTFVEGDSVMWDSPTPVACGSMPYERD
jgi:hypothetical protein